MTRTCITISGLRLYCHHGVGAQERRTGNWFVFDLRLYYDASAAMQTDEVVHALNYAEVADTVRECSAVPCALLEHLTLRIRQTLGNRFPQITGGAITVTKPQPPVPVPFEASFTLEW